MLFGIAATLFVVGLGMILIGDRLRRGQPAGLAVPEKFWDWFLRIVKNRFKVLTDEDAGSGEKLAAAGTMLVAASVIAFAAGIMLALGGNGGDGSTTTSTTTSTSAG